MKVFFLELNGFMIKQDIVKHLNTLEKHHPARIIVTNGFCKRTNKLPLAEKAIALENKKIYEYLYEE